MTHTADALDPILAQDDAADDDDDIEPGSDEEEDMGLDEGGENDDEK